MCTQTHNTRVLLNDNLNFFINHFCKFNYFKNKIIIVHTHLNNDLCN